MNKVWIDRRPSIVSREAFRAGWECCQVMDSLAQEFGQ